VSQHPSSGVLKTVTAASGTGHNTGTATFLQRGLIRPRWREVFEPKAVTARSGHSPILPALHFPTSSNSRTRRPMW